MKKKLIGYRKEVYDIISKSKKPLFANEIFNRMKKKPDISSLYRALQFLISEKYIKYISFFENTRLFFNSKSPHIHFIYCTKCQKVKPFKECNVKNIETEICKNYNFNIYEHYLFFTGICNLCKKQKNN